MPISEMKKAKKDSLSVCVVGSFLAQLNIFYVEISKRREKKLVAQKNLIFRKQIECFCQCVNIVISNETLLHLLTITNEF